jgi:SAM-dependent methyltransferase
MRRFFRSIQRILGAQPLDSSSSSCNEQADEGRSIQPEVIHDMDLSKAKSDVAPESTRKQSDKPDPHAKPGRSILSCQDGTRFDVAGDVELFTRIVHDMQENGKELVPSGVWSEYSVDTKDDISSIFTTRFSSLLLMMDPWIGQVGMQPVSEEQVEIYRSLLKQIDVCGLVGDDLYTTAQLQNFLNTDLGSIMDVNIIAGMVPFQSKKRTCVLEVGGGYGRLAEALTNSIDHSLHYVLVDAVPGSLLYAKKYLEKAFPGKRVGFYLDDVYDESYDFYIVTPWHQEMIQNTRFDIAINIESMQEMEKKHIEFYIALFDRLLKENGHVYISNSRAYRYKGAWEFPHNWELLICSNTPRSWTNDHPTMMFQKGKGVFTNKNNIVEAFHVQQIRDWDLTQKMTCLTNEIQWRDEELHAYREKTT